MLNLECKAKMSPAEASEKIKSFFGTKGLGLTMVEEAQGCLRFEGGGGYVTANLCEEEGRTKINLLTQEWERDVKRFAAEIG